MVSQETIDVLTTPQGPNTMAAHCSVTAQMTVGQPSFILAVPSGRRDFQGVCMREESCGGL